MPPQVTVRRVTLAETKRRVLVVGDVHGFRNELDALLTAAAFDSATDQLCFVGDLVDGGPDDAGVIDLAMRHDAWAVLGNHDLAYLALRGKDQKLRSHHLEWLAALPHVLCIGDDYMVVHAALDKSGVETTSVRMATHQRNWGADWPGPRFCVFGHNGKMRVYPHAVCIDSGISHGSGLLACIELPDRKIHVAADRTKRQRRACDTDTNDERYKMHRSSSSNDRDRNRRSR